MSTIKPEDRMPTIDEFRSFDPTAAWDRLSPGQQRAIGILAIELSVTTGLLNYENTYTKEEREEISQRGDNALTLFDGGTEPLWHLMFGWSDVQPSPVALPLRTVANDMLATLTLIANENRGNEMLWARRIAREAITRAAKGGVV